MVRLFPLLLGLLASCTRPISPPGPALQHGDDMLDAHVNSCHDGDTCRIRLTGGLEINVRLAGIDAPEVRGRGPGQPFGDDARVLVNQLVRGQPVRIRAIDLDRYNRPVVEIWTGDTMVNLRLIEAGLAEVYRRAPPALNLEPFLAAEAAAKAKGIGVWSQARYVPPAEFRRTSRTH